MPLGGSERPGHSPKATESGSSRVGSKAREFGLQRQVVSEASAWSGPGSPVEPPRPHICLLPWRRKGPQARLQLHQGRALMAQEGQLTVQVKGHTQEHQQNHGAGHQQAEGQGATRRAWETRIWNIGDTQINTQRGKLTKTLPPREYHCLCIFF